MASLWTETKQLLEPKGGKGGSWEELYLILFYDRDDN